MIVCLCRAVSDGTLRALVDAGVRSLDALEAACGAGGDCGACGPLLMDLLDDPEGSAYAGSGVYPGSPP